MPPYSHIHNHQQPFFCGGQVSEYLLIEFLLFIRKKQYDRIGISYPPSSSGDFFSLGSFLKDGDHSP
jgi:hypothetical protein